MTATVRVSGLRGFASIVSKLGGDPSQLTRDCGIDPDVLGSEDALIPYRPRYLSGATNCTKWPSSI